jgi:hypothetical protein
LFAHPTHIFVLQPARDRAARARCWLQWRRAHVRARAILAAYDRADRFSRVLTMRRVMRQWAMAKQRMERLRAACAATAASRARIAKRALLARWREVYRLLHFSLSLLFLLHFLVGLFFTCLDMIGFIRGCFSTSLYVLVSSRLHYFGVVSLSWQPPSPQPRPRVSFTQHFAYRTALRRRLTAADAFAARAYWHQWRSAYRHQCALFKMGVMHARENRLRAAVRVRVVLWMSDAVIETTTHKSMILAITIYPFTCKASQRNEIRVEC